MLEVWALEPSEEVLHTLLRDLFTNHWRDITFGPLVQGAAYELRAPGEPTKITLLDGYLTVDWGGTHFHLCIGQTCGHPDSPTDSLLAEHRRTQRAELYRRINRDGTPDTCVLRIFNGKGDQQITVLFPNPFLTEDLTFADQPDGHGCTYGTMFGRPTWACLRTIVIGLGDGWCIHSPA